MKLYGIKNCDSVRKVRKAFDSANVAYEFVDLKVVDIPVETITSWVEAKGINIVLNKRGTTYRTLKLKDQNLSDETLIDVMAKEQMLLKRPIIEHEGSLYIGANEALELIQ
jgi:Spx/MgsR family transcriptional regulator